MKHYSVVPSQFSLSGKWAFVLSLLFVFSISAQFRLNFADLLVHPYLLALPFVLIASGFNVRLIPRNVILPLFLFLLFFSLGSLQNYNPAIEIIKVGAALFTLIFFAQSVRSVKDFRLISWGFLTVSVVIGVMGFFIGEESEAGNRLSGINVLEGLGNKNAQSLFTLPGLFLSVFLSLYYLKRRKPLLTLILLCCIFFITIQIFLSANRSGWLGLFVIFVSYLFFARFSFRALLIGIVLAIFTYMAVENYAADIYERKSTQTLEGYESDVGRRILIVESLSVGLENPVLGIGFDRLTEEMASRLGVNRLGISRTDPHFLFGYIFGATGIFSLFFFLLFLWKLCQRRVQSKRIAPVAHQAWVLLVSFVALFVIRSLFTREILYSPTFIGGLGLIYGYYLMHVRNVNIPR